MKFAKEISFLIKNVREIPDKYWVPPKGGYYGTINTIEETVCWFMDRQKPSVMRDYSFDEERFGLNRKGEVIWGFDSGCSCPTPWENPKYNVKTWKEFKANPESAFDANWEDACYEKMLEIIKEIKK